MLKFNVIPISYPNDPYETFLETVEETTTTVHYLNSC